MKKFTIANLKNGDMVVLRDGSIGVVMRNVAYSSSYIIFNDGGFEYLSKFDTDLTFISYDPMGRRQILGKCDIIKAFRNITNFNEVERFLKYDIHGAALIYDREKVEKEKVEEMTLEEICKALGKNIKIVKEHNND